MSVCAQPGRKSINYYAAKKLCKLKLYRRLQHTKKDLHFVSENIRVFEIISQNCVKAPELLYDFILALYKTLTCFRKLSYEFFVLFCLLGSSIVSYEVCIMFVGYT